jgi:hypothetical protein
MVGKINQGADFNFFRKIVITNGSFPAEAQVVFNIKHLQNFTMMNEGPGDVEYSFNGNVLHGDMVTGAESQNLIFNNRRVSFIWFRLTAGMSATIRIEGWAAV